MKKTLCALIASAAIAATLGLAACGGSSDSSVTPGGGNTTGNTTGGGGQGGTTGGGGGQGGAEAPKYTVSFDTNGGSDVQAVNGEVGTAVPAVSTTRTDYFFGGWYSDVELTNAATVPATVPDHDVKLYAKWITAKEYFLTAREKLLAANAFEYDFDLDVTTKIKVSSLYVNGPTAITDGNLKYNSASSTSYLKVEQNSGALLSDGTVYTYEKDNSLGKIKVNEDGKVYSFDAEPVTDEFKYESSMYAQALFEFKSEDIKDVKSATDGKYSISYNSSAAGKVVSGAFKVLNSPILAKFISVPATDNAVTCLVSFDANGNIKTYEYDFAVTVAGQQVDFHYDLEFKSIGSGVTINDVNFAGIAVSGSVFTQRLGEISSAITAYRALETSGYNYDVKTEVDFVAGGNSIGSRTQGRTMRKLSGGEVYFWNRIEFDSDYKNADLYKDNGIVDYERYRAKIANGDVYDVVDGLIHNTATKVDSYDAAIDEYYFLPAASFFSADMISLVQYTESGTDKVYSLGVKNEGVRALLGYIDDSVRVDVALANDVKIYDIKDDSLKINGVTFDITLKNNALYSIKVKIKGSANGAYAGTDFSGDYNFSLVYSIEANDKAASYEIPASEGKIKLYNS